MKLVLNLSQFKVFLISQKIIYKHLFVLIKKLHSILKSMTSETYLILFN